MELVKVPVLLVKEQNSVVNSSELHVLFSRERNSTGLPLGSHVFIEPTEQCRKGVVRSSRAGFDKGRFTLISFHIL